MIKEAIAKLIKKKDLTQKETETAISEIMEGQATDSQIAAFLVALRMKGETVDEIFACAKVMRRKAATINPKVDILIDTCGTGGDESNTFNISTTAAFVVAGCGIPVAKHGNKATSSHCGSADVLKQLGVNIKLNPKNVEKCIEKIGIGFMFAPLFHKAMKHAIGPRKELGIRTVFNVLGPLTNPANAQAQVVGVFDEKLTEPLAEVLGKLGVKHAFVVHGNGLDEITVNGKTKISEYKNGQVITYEIDPRNFGIKLAGIDKIRSHSLKNNAKILLEILKGKKGARRDIVLLNAAAAIVAADKAHDLKKGIRLAEQSIDLGNALKKFEELKKFSNL